MFHYRLTLFNNRSRMYIATFLAILLHIGFIHFEFVPKQIPAPRVSLPRSVSVVLGQRKAVETQAQQTEKDQAAVSVLAEQPVLETEPEKPVLQKISPVREKKDYPIQHSPLPQKALKKPVIEKSMPASQPPESIEKDSVSAPLKTDKVHVSAIASEPHAVQENEGVTQPGTLMMAYPRYQLNTPPKYPGLARKRGQEGTVILQVLVNREGRVDDLKIDVSSNFSLLDRAALKAVRKWNFEPGKQGDERVAMWVRVPVTFKLKN